MPAQAERQTKNCYIADKYTSAQIRAVLGVSHADHWNLIRSGIALSAFEPEARHAARNWPLCDVLALASVCAMWRLTGWKKWSAQALNRALVGTSGGARFCGSTPLAPQFKARAEEIMCAAAQSGEVPALWRVAHMTPIYLLAVLRDPFETEPSMHVGALESAPVMRAGIMGVNLTEIAALTQERLHAQT